MTKYLHVNFYTETGSKLLEVNDITPECREFFIKHKAVLSAELLGTTAVFYARPCDAEEEEEVIVLGDTTSRTAREMFTELKELYVREFLE